MKRSRFMGAQKTFIINRDIRVNAIAQGYHVTDMTKWICSYPDDEEKIANRATL